jgi:hypothetical protein
MTVVNGARLLHFEYDAPLESSPAALLTRRAAN